MRKIARNEVTEKITVCPYCMSQVNPDSAGHCGESRGHFETGYVLSSGEIVLASETELITDRLAIRF